MLYDNRDYHCETRSQGESRRRPGPWHAQVFHAKVAQDAQNASNRFVVWRAWAKTFPLVSPPSVRQAQLAFTVCVPPMMGLARELQMLVESEAAAATGVP